MPQSLLVRFHQNCLWTLLVSIDVGDPVPSTEGDWRENVSGLNPVRRFLRVWRLGQKFLPLWTNCTIDAVSTADIFFEDGDRPGVTAPSTVQFGNVSHHSSACFTANIFRPRRDMRSIPVTSTMRPSLISPAAHAMRRFESIPMLRLFGVIWDFLFAMWTDHVISVPAPGWMGTLVDWWGCRL